MEVAGITKSVCHPAAVDHFVGMGYSFRFQAIRR